MAGWTQTLILPAPHTPTLRTRKSHSTHPWPTLYAWHRQWLRQRVLQQRQRQQQGSSRAAVRGLAAAQADLLGGCEQVSLTGAATLPASGSRATEGAGSRGRLEGLSPWPQLLAAVLAAVLREAPGERPRAMGRRRNRPPLPQLALTVPAVMAATAMTTLDSPAGVTCLSATASPAMAQEGRCLGRQGQRRQPVLPAWLRLWRRRQARRLGQHEQR